MAHADPLAGFRIDAARPLCAELDRISDDELRHIEEQLASAACSPEETVHRCRKSIKRLRAITLLGRCLDREKSKRLDEGLRGAGHALAAARDAGVMRALASDLARDGLIDRSTCSAVARAAQTGDVSTALSDCRLALEEAGPLLHSLFAADSTVNIRDIEAGVGRAYRRARKALGRFRKSRTQEDGHRFRRTLQRHLAQIRLIEPLAHLPLSVRIASLEKLSELLGRHHDLALLQQLLEQDAPDAHDTSRRQVLATIGAQQRSIDRHARRTGERLFQASTDEFIRAIFATDNSEAKGGESARGD